MSDRSERGQALVLIALAFIGLAAFIGLTVDAGILFSQIGQLRRGVDAASLAAANQFREGREPWEISQMAEEMLRLNGLEPSGVTAKICVMKFYPNPVTAPYDAYHDATVCPDNDGDGIGDYPPNPPFTKEVRVEADLPVKFAFLPIIGWGEITISADAVSEAASVDLVLVLDNSGSMAFGLCDNGVDDDSEGDGDDCNGVPDPSNSQQGTYSDAEVDLCNPAGTCQPFEDLRDAAKQLAAQMYFPYDRMAVVTYSQYATVEVNLADGDNLATVDAALDAMEVAGPPLADPDPGATCHWSGGNEDPRGCTSTNTAEGLIVAGNLLADPNEDGIADDFREEAVWIVILLSDGGANAARQPSPADPTDPDTWYCPGAFSDSTWVLPFCRDEAFETDYNPLGFDAEDAAYDAGLFVGCPDQDDPFPTPVLCSRVAPGGQGAVIFTIGLGKLMWDSESCDLSIYTSGCDAAQGEDLLRAIAGIGDDGIPLSETDPSYPGAEDLCAGVPNSTDVNPRSCGNYYFAKDGSALDDIFEAIASRIFTRITH